MSKALLLAALAGLLAIAHADRSLKQDVYGDYGGGGGGGGGGTAGTTGVGTEGVTGGAAVGVAASAITSVPGGLSVNPWMLNQNFGDQSATVGDTITFTWPMATHGVYIIPTGQCPSTFQNGRNGQQEVQEAVPGPKTASFKFTEAKTYWFACPVDGHCAAGMLFKVTVT